LGYNVLDALWISTVGVIGGSMIKTVSFTSIPTNNPQKSFSINDLIRR